MIRFKKVLYFILILSFSVFSNNNFLGVWVSKGNVWKKILNDPFPVQMIVKDLAEIGVTDILFFEQVGRGGPFLHPTEVKNALTDNSMGSRDFLKEILEETKKYNINVYLAWTPPSKGSEIKGGMYDIDFGLNSSELRKVYKDLIKEVGEKYKTNYKNLAGIMWHELDCSEAVDNHEDDIEEFKRFCKDRFGEEYKEVSMPKTNPDDKWWRRYVLWKNEIINSFMKEMAEVSKKYNLKTFFCFYMPEAFSGESWKWGYDIIELEKICEHNWVSGYVVEGGKFYQSIKGVVVDFGPSYREQILSRNYSYAFHGLPLNYFTYNTPIYIEEMRKYYSSIKGWTEQYGDIYTGYLGHPEKAVELFFGKENFKNWVNLMLSFQVGVSPSKIAVSINPMPFVMKYPISPGIEYDKKVRSLMEGLTRFFDVDGFISGSLKMDENLKKYSFIIIPEDMAIAFKKDVYDRYLRYVKERGKLLIINTPITTGKEDLTEILDKTEEISGIKIKKRNPPMNIEFETKEKDIKCPDKKIWIELSEIEVKKAEIIVKEKNTGLPVLTRYKLGKGEVYFSSISFSPEISYYFSSIIERAVNSPIKLKADGIRILESVKKDEKLAISLWGQGKGILKVDTKMIGMKTDALEVREIITGKIIKQKISPELLAKEGVEVEIKYVNQPYIVGIGSQKLKEYKGIYKNEDVFEGLFVGRVVENPEVPIIVPEGKGARIGVYHAGLGTESIIKVLQKEGLRVFSLPRLDKDALSKIDVLIIPQCQTPRFFNQAIKDIREFVENGGGILLTHDAVGYRKHEVIFPEIGKGVKNPELFKAKVVKTHPVTEGLKIGEEIEHKYFDHVGMEKGEKGEVLLKDEEDYAVLIVGNIGKGKVVLNGMISGYGVIEKESRRGKETEPEGGELKILINSVKWLSEGKNPNTAEIKKRDKEVGVIQQKDFEYKYQISNEKNYGEPVFKFISELGLKPEWVSSSIFLPENKEERDRYKRIVITAAGNYFTPEMYEGMTEYVKNGGLLITNSSLILIDANRNNKADEEDKTFKKPGFETIGIWGHASSIRTKIKVELDCSLTEGLNIGNWEELGIKVGGRDVTNSSAQVVIVSDKIKEDKDIGIQPFLTFKKTGKGACIYMAPSLDKIALENKIISTIFKNVLSEKTLKWLCE